MRKIIGKGAPTTKTKGALGDIYTDRSTMQQYKCSFAYRSNSEEYYEWKNVGKEQKDFAITEVEENKPTVNQEIKKQEPKAVKNENRKQVKTDYTQYSTTVNKDE